LTCFRSQSRHLLWLVFPLLLCSTAWARFNPTDFQPLEGQTIADIAITGNKITKEYVIRREIYSEIGDTLSVETLTSDVVRLENLSIFSSTEISATESDTGLVLTYEVREMPWIIPYPALSFSEENGWSIGLGGTSINLLGRAIATSGSFMFGGTTQFDFGFYYPWIMGNHVSLDAVARHLERKDKLNEFDEKSNEVTPILGTYLGRGGRGRAILSWFQMNSDVDGKTLSSSNTDNLFRAGVSLGFDSRNSWRDPHQGWLLEGSMIATGGILPGDGSFWSGVVDVRRYQPAYKGHTLVLGGLYTPQSGVVGETIPEYLQYYMGGTNSIRGYELQGLGSSLYGKSQLILTSEYRVNVLPIREYRLFKWAVSMGLQFALLTDVGTAWNHSEQLGESQRFKAGFGAGLRLLLPGVEMLRFDFAMGEDRVIRFHFGVQSKLNAQRERLR
jgi:outer membrane protein insertion porin family